MKILAILPAWNEAAVLAEVIEELTRKAPDVDILVVNDGSTDQTEAVARKGGRVRVVSLPFNLGIGGAVQTGFMYAARRAYDLAIQIDADGQHPPDQIPALLAPLLAGQTDVVIGSRYLGPREKGSTAMRRAGTRILSVLASLTLRQAITDSTSGFRAYNRNAIEFLAAQYPLDYPEPEAVVLLGRNGFRILEVPTALRARSGGRSSITRLRSIYYMVKVSLAMLIEAFRTPIKERRP